MNLSWAISLQSICGIIFNARLSVIWFALSFIRRMLCLGELLLLLLVFFLSFFVVASFIHFYFSSSDLNNSNTARTNANKGNLVIVIEPNFTYGSVHSWYLSICLFPDWHKSLSGSFVPKKNRKGTITVQNLFFCHYAARCIISWGKEHLLLVSTNKILFKLICFQRNTNLLTEMKCAFYRVSKCLWFFEWIMCVKVMSTPHSILNFQSTKQTSENRHQSVW